MALALSPSRRHVYVANALGKTLATFELDPVAGTLSRIGLTATEAQPWSLQMHPSGRFLYVKSADTAQVQVFSLDAISGLPTSSGPANRLGRDMVLDPAGRSGQMLAPAGGLFSFDIDSSSGGIVPIAGQPSYAPDSYFQGKLVMAPSGGYLLAASFDPQTGGQGIVLWRRDPASGLMLGLPERPQAVGFDDTRTVMSLALSPTGRYMVFVREDLRTYPERFGNPTIHFATIDPGTGRVSYSAALGQQIVLERLNRFVSDWSLTFDPSEKLVYVSRGDGHVDTYAIEPQDGSIRPSDGINVHPEHVDYSPYIVQTVVFELRPETPAQARARLRKPVGSARPLKAPARAP